MARTPDRIRMRRSRERKKRGQRLVTIRITDAEINEIKARGYLPDEGDVPLGAAVEAFVSDTLAVEGAEFGGVAGPG
jgi:hypothetical protein